MYRLSLVLILFTVLEIQAQFELIGDAVMTGPNTFVLTEDLLNENGSVWHQLRHDFSTDFRVSGEFYFGDFEDGADGIVFVIQDNCIGAGGLGLGIGYGGFPGRSLGVEFDTYQNVGGVVNDPEEDHIAISRDGNVDHLLNLIGPVQMHPSQTNVEDGNWYSYDIIYDALTGQLDIYFANDLRMSYTIDIVNTILDGNPFAYWGFTSATGGFSAANALRILEYEAYSIPDTTLCSGTDGITITMPYPDIEYIWTPVDGLMSDATGQNVTLNPSVSTTYTVSLPDICLGSVEFTFDILISDFEVIPSSSAVTCEGTNNGIASVSIIGDSGPYNYLWSTNETENSIEDLAAGSYTVTITDTNLCSKVATILVTSFPELMINPIVTNVDCFGNANGEIILDPTGGISPYQYLWSTNENTSSISDLEPNTYLVTVTDNVGCEASTTITVESPNALLEVSLADIGSLTCDEDQVTTASAIVIGGTPPYSYSWSNGDTGPNTENLGIGTTELLVTDDNGCMATEEITLTIDNPFTVNTMTTNIICNGEQGGAIEILASGGNPPYSYYLLEDEILVAIQSLNENLSAGLYELVVEDDNGCAITITATISLEGGLSITAGSDQVIVAGQSVLSDAMVTSSTVDFEISWSPTIGLSCIDCIQPIFSPTVSTAYTLTVTDDNGCISSDEVYIEVELDDDVKVFIPNVFTPSSGDENSQFKLYGDDKVVSVLSVQIYDRWGNLIFKDTSLDAQSYQGWDGTFNGDPVQAGVYVYIFDIELIDGKNLIYSGDVSVIK